MARSIAHTNTQPDGTTIPQIVIYSQGVGSNTDALGKDGFVDGMTEWLNKMLGGIFGEGIEDNIVETYLRLAHRLAKLCHWHWQANDPLRPMDPSHRSGRSA